MSNQKETFNGVEGVWKTVTHPDQIHDRQRIRYYLYDMSRKDRIGYTKARDVEARERFASRNQYGFDSSAIGYGQRCMFDDKDFKMIQAWFPLIRMKKGSK